MAAGVLLRLFLLQVLIAQSVLFRQLLWIFRSSHGLTAFQIELTDVHLQQVVEHPFATSCYHKLCILAKAIVGRSVDFLSHCLALEISGALSI